MSTPFEPVHTANINWDSDLPYSIEFCCPYFPEKNAHEASRKVFIDGNQLLTRWQNLSTTQQSQFVIAETGFGSGLNFLLTCLLWQQYAPPTARLYYISCEKNPFSFDDLKRCLALWPQLQELSSQLLAVYPVLTPGFHTLQFATERVTLTLMLGDVLNCYRELLICGDENLERQLRPWCVDAWFLDGFAPVKNPNMWSDTLFTLMQRLSNPHTTVATSFVDKQTQQSLQAAGFYVRGVGAVDNLSIEARRPATCSRDPEILADTHAHCIKSDPNGPREHVAGRRRMNCQQTLGACDPKTLSISPRVRIERHTPWFFNSQQTIKKQHAIILGAGLAGCYTAYALAKRGWRVTLMDARSRVGSGASGNQYTVLYPKLSSYRSPLTEFMLSSFLFAVREYKSLLTGQTFGELNGIFQLPYRKQEQLIQESLIPWLLHYPELGSLIDAERASEIVGVSLKSGGLFIPQAGWIDASALCQFLIQHSGIQCLLNTPVSQLNYVGDRWCVGEESAEIVVISNGYQANQFAQTKHLPLKAMHGQMTVIPATPHSGNLRMPLCGAAHILPMRNDKHGLGATYNPAREDDDCSVTDDQINLASLMALPTDPIWSLNMSDHWAGVRGATPDYLPLVGPVAQESLFRQRFAGLASNSKRWLPFAGAYYRGLYICAGFGSRGLTTIPLCAEYLAALIHQAPTGMPRTMIQAVSPARFLRRSIIRG